MFPQYMGSPTHKKYDWSHYTASTIPILLSFTLKSITELLLLNIPATRINRRQLVLNSAACAVTRTPKFHHVTPILKSVHWLTINYVYTKVKHGCRRTIKYRRRTFELLTNIRKRTVLCSLGNLRIFVLCCLDKAACTHCWCQIFRSHCHTCKLHCSSEHLLPCIEIPVDKSKQLSDI